MVCPICKTQSQQTAIRNDFRLQQFMEVLAEQKAIELEKKKLKKRPCDPEEACALCKKKEFKVFCEQCKQWLCYSCKLIHLRCKTTSAHSFISIAEEALVLQAQFHEQFQKFRSTDYQKVTTTDMRLYQKFHVCNEEVQNYYSELATGRSECFAAVNQFFDDVEKQADLKIDQLNRLREKRNESLFIENDVSFLEGVASMESDANAQFITQHTKALQSLPSLSKSCDEFTTSSAQLCEAINCDALHRVKFNKEKFLELLQQSVLLEKIDSSGHFEAKRKPTSCTISKVLKMGHNARSCLSGLDAPCLDYDGTHSGIHPSALSMT